MKSLPKLQVPVRDETSFRVAIEAGADAVYFGLGKFNMRASSKGISIEDLPRIVKEAHQKNVKVYTTLNSIVYEDELEDIDDIIKIIKEAKVDAVIAWDQAVISKLKEAGVPFHISTQASVSNSESVKFYKDLGAKCVVLARECTLEQIADIKRRTDIKIEVFIHGAMCVSISGRCFMSQFLHCKSANRGECWQPCRQEYIIKDKRFGYELIVDNGYVMSPKDLCTIMILDKIIDTGVDILKIEGRGRSPEYIQTTTQVYRQALDAIKENKYSPELKKELLRKLKKVYNRGFSTGFFLGVPGKEGWAKCSESQATEKKEHIGFVSNYFKKTKIAEIKIQAEDVKRGDLVQFEGHTTGLKRFKIKTYKKYKGGLITFPCSKLIRRRDKVYKVFKA